MPTCCTVLVAAGALLLVHVASAQYSRRSTPVGYAEEVLHEHSLSNYRYSNSQRRNSKSMGFLDYFFPPSRTPKVSNAFAEPKKNDSDSVTISASTTEGTTHPVQYSTQEEARATGSTRKGTTTKRKSSSARQPSSTTPKNKISTEKSTIKSTTPNKTPTIAASSKSTHKHYTIYPTIAKSNSAATGKSGNTSMGIGLTTQGMQKVTELGKVSATEKSTSSAGTSPAETSSTEIDGREGEYELRDKPEKQSNNDQTNKESVLPAGSTSVLAKPTKYHYYPHNQHIYLLPECAIQQVCNAVYVRLNYTQPLCACPARHRDPCSASLNADDLHTTLLTTDSKKKYAHKAITLVKTCEATSEMRECRAPRDWSLLALQNIRTGKSHYLVICRCPEEFVLEGPMSHDQPTYASVPGIRVYGMMCVQPTQSLSTAAYNSVTSRPTTNSVKVGYSQPATNQDQTHSRYPGYAGPGLYYNRMARRVRDTRRAFHRENMPPFPWEKARELALTADWDN